MEQPPKQHGLSANWAVREVDHLFSRLGRYTRFVFFSKWFLALFAVALLAALIAWPYFSRQDQGMRISFVSATGRLHGPATEPRMEKPVYEGFNDDHEPFKVTGNTAIQKSADIVVIEQVSAQLVKKSGGWLSLTSDRAVFYKAKNRLDLAGQVNVMNDQGYNFLTSSAQVDTKTMHVIGHEPVRGVGPAGKLLASGFEITDNGAQVHFLGAEGTTRPGRVNVEVQPAKKP
jgi:lipopolysaccharide export system protein LptC